MKFLGKKAAQETATTEPKKVGRRGRSLLMYFLPPLVVAVVLMLGFGLVAQFGISSAARDAALSSARSVVDVLAGRIEGAIAGRYDLLAVGLSDGRAARALEGKDPVLIKAAVDDLQRRIPGVLQLRLLTPDENQPDPSGPAPMSYAGLDVVRRTLESGRPAPAEAHQIKSGAPYLALTLPVSANGKVVGVLFAAWDLRQITALVERSPAFPGRLELVQGTDQGFVLAQGPGRIDDPLDLEVTAVPQSIWRIGYDIAPDTGLLGGLTALAGVVVAGGLLLLLIILLSWRGLSRDLRSDMGVMVNLSEAILTRGHAPIAQPSVSSSADAMALLGQFAQDARVGGGGASPAPASGARPTPNASTEQKPQGLQVEEIDSDPAEFLAGSAPAGTPPSIEIPETLFRAYDLRGVVGDTLTPEIAELLGQALATLVQEQGGRKLAVARDARLSSPALADALMRGLMACGCDVLDIGQAPTPLLYFALHTQAVQAGVMVTGSHNPAEYNGFKIVIGDRVLDGEELQALRQRMIDGVFGHGSGQLERVDLLGDYVDAVAQEVQLARPLRVVVDAGNGVAGDQAIATLEALGCEVTPLFCEPDGEFPNHHPDPSQPDNLASLLLEVQAQEADLGIAFDGDGDRLGVIDDAGNVIWPDRLLMMLAADVLERHPGVDILYDVKSSRHLASFVLSHGGRPIMWKSGHSRMRAKMLETGALLGGEFSGHLFIKERWYGFDDGVYAAARLLEILALEQRKASELFAELPASPSTPEYHLMLREGQNLELMRALDAHKVFDDARLVELDGLRVEFADGWGLIRPSNTTPSLTFRFEAEDEGALEGIKARFRDLLRRVAPDMQAPF